MRVAVIFMGVARRLDLTIESIKRNIYDPNRSKDVSLYTIAALNIVKHITNPRNNEVAVPYSPANVFLLQADYYSLLNQDDAAIAPALAAAQRQSDLENNGWISVRNALHQWASLRRAWSMAHEVSPGGFDYYLFVRPDMIYLDPVDIPGTVSRFEGSNNLALPAWHSWYGFNDRIALTDYEGGKHYVSRLNLVEEYTAKWDMHPETMLAYALHKGECKIGRLPVRARRVRAHGEVKEENFSEAVLPLPAIPARFTRPGGKVAFAPQNPLGSMLRRFTMR